MKKVKVHVSTNRIGSDCTRIIEFEDDADEDEIQEMVNEVANEMINVWHEELE